MKQDLTPSAFLEARDFLLTHRTDYATALARFTWPRLDTFNWALDYFDPMAAGNASVALVVADEAGRSDPRSFADLAAQSNRVANHLRRLGARRGDRLLLMLGNEAALWESLLAAMKLGVVVIPATTLLAPADLRDRLERGRVRHVITSHEQTPKFSGLPGQYTRVSLGAAPPGWHLFEEAYDGSSTFVPDAATRASDPLLLYFTSGTTAQPKLVEHTHASYPIGHLSTMYWIGLQPGDVHWNISSPGWAKHAWSCVFAPWNAGATVFTLNYARFQARLVLDALVRHRVTTLCAPPTVWRLLIQEDLQAFPVSLREVVSAGEPLNPEVIDRVRRAWGLTVRDGYGQTETTAQIGNPPGQPVKPGSMGRCLPGYRLSLRGPEGTQGPEGEICLDLSERPVGLMRGYAGDGEKTAEAMAEGRYHTGDVALMDTEGYVTYVGRADDVFKASDYRISPFELESVLVEHPAVTEAAVVPSPDPVRLAVPKAFIVLAPGREPTPELARDIFAFARARLSPFKRIRRLEFAELPKTISGKIRRVELRKLEEARPPGGARRPAEYFEEDVDETA